MKWWVLLLLGLFLSGCEGSASRQYQIEDIYTQEKFDTGIGWREYDQAGVRLTIANGKYRGEMDGGVYVWGINATRHTDVVMEIEAEQVSEGKSNGYGVVCRADPSNDGDGYYFLISGDGGYSIRRGRDQEVKYLVAWQQSGAVLEGRALNTIRAVCIGEYLAMYVNDQFVAETTDSLYGSGYAGVAFTSTENTPLIVEFDNLTIWEGTLSE